MGTNGPIPYGTRSAPNPVDDRISANSLTEDERRANHQRARMRVWDMADAGARRACSPRASASGAGILIAKVAMRATRGDEDQAWRSARQLVGRFIKQSLPAVRETEHDHHTTVMMGGQVGCENHSTDGAGADSVLFTAMMAGRVNWPASLTIWCGHHPGTADRTVRPHRIA